MAQGRKQRPQPERSCVACRSVRPKRELLRVVRQPDGAIVLDVGSGKIPGRGAYLCKDRACLERARRTRALERALKVPVPEEVLAELERHVAASAPASPAQPLA